MPFQFMMDKIIYFSLHLFLSDTLHKRLWMWFHVALRLVLIKNCINLLTEIAVADSRCDVSWKTDRNRGKIMSQWILMWQKTNRREKERSKERVKMVVEKFADLFSFCHPVQPGLFPQTLSVSLTVSWVSQEITELVFSSLSLWSLYR